MQRVDPDQMLHSVVSDLGLHCLPVTLFGSLQTKMGSMSVNKFVIIT